MNSARGKWLLFEFDLFDRFDLRTDETELAWLVMQWSSPSIEIWYGFRSLVSGGSERWRSWIRSNLSSIERGGDVPTTFGFFSWLGKETEPVPFSMVLLGNVIKLFLIKVLLMYFPPWLLPPIFLLVEPGIQVISLPWMKSSYAISLGNSGSLDVVNDDSFSSGIKSG